jgi:hypothetical protein
MRIVMVSTRDFHSFETAENALPDDQFDALDSQGLAMCVA